MERFDRLLTERLYLIGVSKKTIAYYTWAFNAWNRHARNGAPKEFVVNLRQSGVKPVSVNTYICAMNTYWKWAGEDKHLDYLKEEEKVLPTLSPREVSAVVGFRPKRLWERRIHCLACTILDTGLRATEVLGLRQVNVELDNFTLKVDGKGCKQRLVPFSADLRPILYRWLKNQRGELAFGTGNRTRVSVRNFERDLKKLCLKLGVSLRRRTSFAPRLPAATFATAGTCFSVEDSG